MSDKLVCVGGGRATYDVVDEDNMASDSAVKIPTQQSVKAYADAVAASSGAAIDAKPVYVGGVIPDISTAGSSWVICPIAGTISKIWTVIDGAITGADAALSFELDGSAITDGGITVAYDGSAAGDVDSATPSAANTVTAGQAIEMITDGGSTNAVKATVLFEITPGS